MEFCYLVRRSVLDEDDLMAIDNAIANFHHARQIFQDVGVRPDGISLPRQHSIVHYRFLIQEFGIPNGLCSSITESAHIKAVKEPWCRSNRYEALGQMLIINQRLSKLAACRVSFRSRGMLSDSIFKDLPPVALPAVIMNRDDDDGGAVDAKDIWKEVVLSQKPITSLPFNVNDLADYFQIPQLGNLISRFLYQQENPDFDGVLDHIPIADCPIPTGKIRVYPSAVVTFYAPSDKSGIYGMFRERIRAISSWCRGAPRHDCVFVTHDETLPGFRGLLIAHIRLFFTIIQNGRKYPCALVSWFSAVGDDPDEETGLWIVKPDLDRNGHCIMGVIHIDSILRAAHLIGCAKR
ncbi:hypothetical protein H0H92_011861, partial [Tricholoma furcatifolium]